MRPGKGGGGRLPPSLHYSMAAARDGNAAFAVRVEVDRDAGRAGTEDGEKAAAEEGGAGREVVPFAAGHPDAKALVTRGRVHLYRRQQAEDAKLKTNQLCVLAVPAHMPVSEFCTFIGAYLPQIVSIRQLTNEAARKPPPLGKDDDNDTDDETENNYDTYLMTLTFTSPSVAEEFLETYDGQPYSDLEPFLCRVARVAKVELVPSAVDGTPPPPPPEAHTEVPTCPVCLDRLDEAVSGVVTTSCNHSFHSFCLRGWMDIRCPVCRHCEMPEHSGNAGRHASRCEGCGNSSSLWICLICGYIGCGRYSQAHSKTHAEETGHAYALEIETQRVWDYVGDEYVHRLVRSKADGTVLEVPSGPAGAAADDGEMGEEGSSEAQSAKDGARDLRSSKDGALIGGGGGGVKSKTSGASGGGGGGGGDGDADFHRAVLDSKMEAMHQEYTMLLTNQLTSQREFFEERLAEAATVASTERDAAAARIEALKCDVASADRRNKSTSQQLADALAEVIRLKAELEEERALAVAMRESSAEAQAALEEERAQRAQEAKEHAAAIRSLEETNRDLMLFLESRDKIGSSDAAGGAMLGVAEAPEPEIAPNDRAAVVRARLQKKQKERRGR